MHACLTGTAPMGLLQPPGSVHNPTGVPHFTPHSSPPFRQSRQEEISSRRPLFHRPVGRRVGTFDSCVGSAALKQSSSQRHPRAYDQNTTRGFGLTLWHRSTCLLGAGSEATPNASRRAGGALTWWRPGKSAILPAHPLPPSFLIRWTSPERRAGARRFTLTYKKTGSPTALADHQIPGRC